MKFAKISKTQMRFIENYFTLQDEYRTSVLEHHKEKNPDEAMNHAWAGAIKMIDCAFIAQTLKILKPKNILEIGSFIGFSTRWLLDKTEDWAAEVTSIDPNIPHRLFQNPRKHLNAFCNKHKHRLKTIDAFLSEAHPGFPDRPVITEPIGEYDFAFIDGNHKFRSTLLNAVLVARMMPKGGLIITHDAISWPEVVPAIETLSAASSEIDYCVLGSSFFGGQVYLPRENIKISSMMLHPLPKPPKTLSLRQWNHYRLARRHLAPVPIWCDGLVMIKVPNRQKLADLVLDPLLARKNEMLPKKDEIIQQRSLPGDDPVSFLSR